jgi:DNA polymerase I-like protein with 3'-5' exonuclease and polymerase domains
MRRKQNIDVSNALQSGLFMPQSDWRPPKKFPDLSGEKIIGLDIETKDTDLVKRGPGFIRGDAEVIGVSVATTESSWYFPIGHLGGGNMGRESVDAFIRDIVKVKDRFICGANLQYELEGLDSRGIEICSKLIDVQVAEALINEESETTALDALCVKYLHTRKDEALLRQAAEACGLRDVKGNIWKLHSQYVGPYAEWDAKAPLLIFQEQLKTLKEENLESIFTLESKLLPLLWQMRKRGIRIDVERAQNLSKSLAIKEQELRQAMSVKYGTEIDEWSGPKIAMICDRLNIKYPKTDVGNPSFTSDYIEGTIHPFFDDLSDLRELSKLKDTFVDGWLLNNLVGEYVHPQWRQIATDEGGTRTGRMAAANPNPQQIPAGKYRKSGKPNDIGAEIRACFIPHVSGQRWAKYDYSEQEPRILTHFAAMMGMPGAVEVARRYQDRAFKIYPFMMEISGLDKRPAKDCYLGRCYGMGIKKLAYKFNKSEDEARQILAKFDSGLPWIKEIADQCMLVAQKRGYVKTLLGRRRHFNLYEPAESFKIRKANEACDARDRVDLTPVPLSVAEGKWRGLRLQRANTHKALNSLIQGSGADMIKAAMVMNWEDLKVLPYMQVHDELNHGVDSDEEAAKIHKNIENCVEMLVPVVSNMTIKENWT